MEFNFFFSQNSFHSYFWGKFGPKIWSSSDWLKFGTEVDYHILILILMFIFSKFCYSYFLWKNLVPQNQEFAKLNKIGSGVHCISLFWLWRLFFQNLFHHFFFFGKFGPKMWNLTEMFFKFLQIDWNVEFWCLFFQNFTNIFGLIWSHKLTFSILTEIWCSIALLYA